MGYQLMKLKCLGSGSSGNCYLLTADNGETLLLDAGLPIMDIKRGLNWNVKCVVGAICTHAHKDHSLSISDLEHMGIKVWQPQSDHSERKIQMGKFHIFCFQVPHNGTENYGFLIMVDGQKLLYLTDLEYCPYVFKKQRLEHMLIECNYQKKYVDMDAPNYVHKVKGHCELETCKGIVEANKSDALQNIILCHLGGDTTDADECVAEVKKIAPLANVDYAAAGKEWILRNGKECPF